MTEEGKNVVTDKRQNHRHSLNLPVEYYLADLKAGNPGFTFNVSEEGLAVDLPEKLEVGQNLKLRILHASYGLIEIFAKVVWTNPHLRKANRVDLG